MDMLFASIEKARSKAKYLLRNNLVFLWPFGDWLTLQNGKLFLNKCKAERTRYTLFAIERQGISAWYRLELCARV